MNQDGVLDVTDVVEVVNIILGISSPNYMEDCLADMNNDSTVNVLDIVGIVNIILSSSPKSLRMSILTAPFSFQDHQTVGDDGAIILF